MIKVGVPGVNGRMGAAIAQRVLRNPQLLLSAATVRPGNSLVNSTVPSSEIIINDSFNNTPLDVVIDFTLPEGVMQHLDYCLQHKIAMVIGATGFTELQLNFIKDAAQQIPILQAYNMSIGVNLYFRLVAQASQLFNKDWQVAIHDLHHIHKKDAPSGTAKELAKIVADSSGRELNNINIYSERIGEACGTHGVVFSSADESINLVHHAENRDIFANGAVQAAFWVAEKKPGLYTMRDFLDTSKKSS